MAAAHAQDTVCARVKIEIKQELTLERQGFDAQMKINNTTDTGVIENVSVVVKVTDENGVPVTVTDDPNNLLAKFFVRLTGKENIADVDGGGVVNPKTTSTMNWLLIPAPGAAGNGALGKKYLVGATLRYKFGGEETLLEVSPDVITVKPLPLLSLDYFLTRDVEADDPVTPAIEPAVPFTLGVRVKNNGLATARNLKIDSAQPTIVENNQGLLVNFSLLGSYVDDAPAQNSLLVNFGDIAGNSSKTARWTMQTSLAGKFTEFSARFTHADELGGALTSILQATNAHLLLRDVRVDLPGRDHVRDFLALDGDVLRVYESDGADTEVVDRSAVASLAVGANGAYRLSFPATAGFAYVRLPDPFGGKKILGNIVRSDAKQMASENIWLSRTRNAQSKQWEYWVNFFDVNTTGVYDTAFEAPPAGMHPPVLQFIPNRTVTEGAQLSFIVEASSPNGKAVSISAAPLPAGARLTPQAADPAAPGLARAVFDWTPAPGSAGTYVLDFSATDGDRSVIQAVTITVDAPAKPAGPGTPTITAPLSGALLFRVRPDLSVQTATAAGDTTTQVQFELYADEAATQLVATAVVGKTAAGLDANGAFLPAPTVWKLPANLDADTNYWWRARAFDGKLYSAWTYARFLVTNNSAPSVFNLTSPAPNSLVASLTPTLSWTNSTLRDGDAVTYAASVYADASLSSPIVEQANIPADPSGTTSWTVPTPLANGTKYYWSVVAARASGGRKASLTRTFTVDTSNATPTAPVLAGAAVTSAGATLSVAASHDPEGDPVFYAFEIDSVPTFDSAARRFGSGGQAGAAGGASWVATGLTGATRYWWRAKASDGRTDSAWTVGQFVFNPVNAAPPVPTVRNPGNGAWTGNRQPSLQANPVKDPDGDQVRYQFEVYQDAGLTQKVADGSSNSSAMIVPQALADKASYWWRVRAVDTNGAASAWSAASTFYLGAGIAAAPSIAVVAPAAPIVPDAVATADGTKRIATIRWEGLDPAGDASVSLYHGPVKGSFSGTPIVEGLRQAAGESGGSYQWDVSALAPGAYQVYAVVFNAQGVGKTYAPGAIVIPKSNSNASLTAFLSGGSYSEGGAAGFDGFELSEYQSFSWSGAARVPMTIPLSGDSYVLTQQFAIENTPASSGYRNMPVMVPAQCSTNAKLLAPQIGPVWSEDPNLAGKLARAPAVGIIFNASNTGNEAMRICDITFLSERPLSSTQSEFLVTARLSNISPYWSKGKAVAQKRTDISVTGTLDFGLTPPYETSSALAPIKVYAPPGAIGVQKILANLRWTLQSGT